MKKVLILLLLVFSISISIASDVRGISNIDTNVKTLTKLDAYWIYTLKTRYWTNGDRIKVFMLDLDSPIHKNFVKNTLGMNPTSFKQSVESSINLGRGSYRIVDNEYEMFKGISIVPGSVGYVSERVLLINGGDGYVREINIID